MKKYILLITSLLIIVNSSYDLSFAERTESDLFYYGKYLIYEDSDPHNEYMITTYYLTQKNIISGYYDNTIRAENNALRSDYVKMLVRMLIYKEIIPEMDTNASMMDYLNKAYEIGLISSKPSLSEYATYLKPDELCALGIRAYKLMGIERSISDELKNQIINEINDINLCKDEFLDGLVTAYAYDFIRPSEGYMLRLNHNVTRGSAFFMVELLLEDSTISYYHRCMHPISLKFDDYDNVSWYDYIRSLPEDKQDAWYNFQLFDTSYENGILTLGRYDDRTGQIYQVSEGNTFYYDDYPEYQRTLFDGSRIPNFKKKFNNLLNYMVHLNRPISFWKSISGEKWDFNSAQVSLPFNDRGFGNECFFYSFMDHYHNLTVEEFHEYTKKKTEYNTSPMYLVVYNQFNDVRPEQCYDNQFYDVRYMQMLQDSLIAFFGEEDGVPISDFVKQETINWSTPGNIFEYVYGQTYEHNGIKITTTHITFVGGLYFQFEFADETID